VVAGPPSLSGLPTWTWVRDVLRDQYLPVDPLLRAMGLLAWGLWAYVALVVALRAVAVLAARRRLAGAAALLAVTNLVTVPVLRSMVDAAVGVSLLASTVTPPPSTGATAASVAVVRTVQAPSEWDRARALLDTVRTASSSARPTAPATTPATSGEPERDGPRRPPDERLPAPHNRRYTVEPGDSLWRIAEQELGDPYRWSEIFALNRGRRMPDGAVFHNPGLIRPSWLLRLPARPDDSAVSPARPPRARDAPGERVAPPTPTTTAREPETRVCPPAVRLPSGSIVGLSVAVGVAGALAVARRRRRHGRLPGEPRPGIRRRDAYADETLRWLERVALGGPGYGDPDADQEEPEEPTRPAPPTQRVLRLLAETEAPPEPVAAQPLHDIAPANAATGSSRGLQARQGEPPWPAPTPVALGHRDGEEVTLELTGAGGLTLTGAGAADAAHALLVAYLSRHTPEAGEVVVADDRLLPGISPFPGLRRHDGLAPALTELEVEVVRRERLLQEAEAGDFASYRRADPAEPMPTLLLATTVPAALAGRLRTLVGIGQRLGIGILAVDEAGVQDAEPWGARLEVDADGALTAARPDEAAARLAGIRLFHLTAEEAAVTLAVLADARGEADLEAVPNQTRDARSPIQAGPVADDPDLGVAAANGGRLAPRADLEASGAGGDGTRTAAPQPSDTPRGTPAVPEDPFEVAPPAGRPLVGVQLLGPYRIEVAGQEVRGRLRTTGRELFAYYLLHPDGATLEGAVDALWPDTPPGRESSRFWNALNSLRARLRSATGQSDLKVLERTNESYRVDPDLVDVDLWRFQRALADARDATTTAGKLAALERAAAAYGGDLLTHTDYTWAEPARVDLRGRAVDALARLAELRDQAGDRHGALAALERAITVDPDCEELYRRLMRLQAELVDPDAVRRTYRRLRAHLLNELDVEPDPTSQELYERLLAKHRRRHPSGLPEQP
jgi:DNA-binding SARP family transcriptional activator